MVNKERTSNQPTKRGSLLTREPEAAKTGTDKSAKTDAHRLAEQVQEAWVGLQIALHDKRKYPVAAFNALFGAVKAYAEITAKEQMIHREVVACVHDLSDYLKHERKRVPGQVLYDADRLECILFAGYDPHFEGDEPPGL